MKVNPTYPYPAGYIICNKRGEVYDTIFSSESIARSYVKENEWVEYKEAGSIYKLV